MWIRNLKLRREIKRCKRKIELIEQRRERSQAALMAAILSGTDPDDRDVDYFNQFTEMIDREREKMHTFMRELKEKKKK